MTQEELAERSGVSVATVRKLEQGGRVTARVSTLYQLARGLGVRTSDLFGVAQPEPADGETQQVGLMALRRVLTPACNIVELADDGSESDLPGCARRSTRPTGCTTTTTTPGPHGCCRP